MSSVTAAGSQIGMMSPRERLQQVLESQIASGEIAATDESALESALDTIDEAMKSGASSTASTPPKPGDMEDKIAALIDRQVEAGTLTSDQAEELKELFASAAPQGDRGPVGAGGPPPPPPQGGTDEASGASSSTSADQLASLLADFLKQLRETTAGTAGYSTDGSSKTTSASALVLDKTA